jgi:hypothetical protein
VLVDYSHFRLVNSNYTCLAKSCTFIDCTPGNSSKHMHEYVSKNMHIYVCSYMAHE